MTQEMEKGEGPCVRQARAAVSLLLCYAPALVTALQFGSHPLPCGACSELHLGRLQGQLHRMHEL